VQAFMLIPMAMAFDSLVSVIERSKLKASCHLGLKDAMPGFDKGIFFWHTWMRELMLNATLLEASEVNARTSNAAQPTGYYSSNPMCEAGMTTAVGEQYLSYLYLVERTTR
jgi:hypothetical protein